MTVALTEAPAVEETCTVASTAAAFPAENEVKPELNRRQAILAAIAAAAVICAILFAIGKKKAK